MTQKINYLKDKNFYKNKEASEVEAYLNETFGSPTEVKQAVSEANSHGRYPVHLVTIYGKPDVLDLLLKKGADPNKFTKITRSGPYQGKLTALHHAAKAENSSYEKVKILIEYGAKIDVKDGGGWQAIHFASQYGIYKTLKLLIDKGADKESRTGSGSQPIELAKGNSRISVVQRNELFFNSS